MRAGKPPTEANGLLAGPFEAVRAHELEMLGEVLAHMARRD